MKTKKISPIGLSITGAGPKIMRPMFLILIIGIIVQLFLPAVSKFPFLTENALKNAGWIFAITGSSFLDSGNNTIRCWISKGEVNNHRYLFAFKKPDLCQLDCIYSTGTCRNLQQLDFFTGKPRHVHFSSGEY